MENKYYKRLEEEYGEDIAKKALETVKIFQGSSAKIIYDLFNGDLMRLGLSLSVVS
jgi:hypothetical protein